MTNPRARHFWLAIGSGQLSAAGAPSRERLSAWRNEGLTDLVTLQRLDEMRSFLPETCAELGIIWHHLPLSGRRMAQAQDLANVANIPALATLLDTERRVLIHCAAGMHRTGLCLYILLRSMGHEPCEVMRLIEAIRPVTADELRRVTRKNGMLLRKAETLFKAFCLGE